MTTTAVVPRTAPELDQYARLGKWLAALESGSDDINAKGAAAALRFYYARELDLPPTAVAEISVIKGRLFIGAQLMRALADRAGYRVERAEGSDDVRCTAILSRADSGEIIGETTFTIDDAKRAGLLRSGSAWQTHPARMLWARASTLVVRDYAPAVSLGLSTDDEIEEITGEVVQVEDLGPVDDVAWPDPANDAQPEPEPEPAEPGISRGQIIRMQELFRDHQMGDTDQRDQRLAYASAVVGRHLTTSKELTSREALQVIEALRADLRRAAQPEPEPPRFEPPPAVREKLRGDSDPVPHDEFPDGF